MIAIAALVLLIGAIVAIVVMVTGSTHRPPETDLAAQLASWVAGGLIEPEQAARISAHEGIPTLAPVTAASSPTAAATPTVAPLVPSPPAPTPALAPPVPEPHLRPALAAVIEGLGYLGGVLAVTGVVLLVAHFWDQLAIGGQLALSGLTALALGGAGLAVPERRGPAMSRLRAFLWILSTSAVGVFAAVAAREVLGTRPVSPVVACTAGAVALTSGFMWWGRARPAQQLIALAAAVVALGTALVEPMGSTVAGLVVWVAGATLLALGIRRRTTYPVLDVAIGAVAVAVGAMVAVVGDGDPGIGLLFVVVTGIAVLTLALLRQLVTDVASIVVLCVVGAITVAQSLPPLVATMARDGAIATGSVLWLSGLAVLAVGVRRLTRSPILLEVSGAIVMLVACAVTAAESQSIATIAGLATSLGLLGLSILPGRVALSPVGALGLLAYVPWAIGWFFPGEGRVPLLISVSGLLIIGVAVLMARSGRRFGSELGHHPPLTP